MQTVTIPELFCPFPVELNPYAEAVDRHTMDWALRHGLLTEPYVQIWRDAKYGWLAARTHPFAAYDELTIVSDWCGWLFLVDDYIDATSMGRSSAEAARTMARLLEILTEPFGERRPADGPFEDSLRDISERVAARATAEWRERFVASCIPSSRSMSWEADNRAAGRTPDAHHYAEMRLHTGAVQTCFVLGELVDGLDVPDGISGHPDVRALCDLANTIVCVQNDLYSLPKELDIEEVHNLVVITQRRDGCSLQEAVETVAAEHDEAMRRFDQMSKSMPSFPAGAQQNVRGLVSLLRHWLRGNLDWSRETGRYRRLLPD